MRALAVVRLPETVGGPAEPFRTGPAAAIQEVAGARSQGLATGYAAVDLDIVWAMVTADLPALVVELEQALAIE